MPVVINDQTYYRTGEVCQIIGIPRLAGLEIIYRRSIGYH
jgi:hypothetical protein